MASSYSIWTITQCLLISFFLILNMTGLRKAAAQTLSTDAHNGSLADATVAYPLSGMGTNIANAGHMNSGLIRLHAVQPYRIKSIAYSVTQFVLPVNTSTLLARVFVQSFSSFQEIHGELGMAHPFSLGSRRKAIVAISGTMKHVSLSNFGSAQNFSATLGASFQLAYNLYLGVNAQNYIHFPGAISLERKLRTGIAYAPHSDFWIMLSFLQSPGYRSNLSIGLEASFTSWLKLRYGFSSFPAKNTLGAGIWYKNLFIDLYGERHFILGWTPGLSIGLAFMRRKDTTISVN